ncbi:hypothetical protein [Rhizobium tubonense]
MARIHRTFGIALVAGFMASPMAVHAEDAMSAPGQKTIGAPSAALAAKVIPSLAVLNSAGATLVDGKLAMTGISPTSIVFADRPFRTAGHTLTSEFVKQWGDGTDSFAKDPPNATISVLSNDGTSVKDAVVTLKMPKLEGGTLTFDVAVLEGDLNAANGPASLFIDWFAARGGFGGGVVVGGGGFYHAPVWRGAYYGHPAYGGALAAGAVIGAAAVASEYHPYYGYARPACGYYPYPPCY